MLEGTTPKPAPVLDEQGLDRFLREIRTNELTLVFTNGCFDLIHPGHVDYLMEARSLGDRLLVGLNSDDSVRRLKGPGRPLVAEQGRSLVLGSLKCVDGIVIFDTDTPRDLILRVRPAILVKGGDYKEQDVVGARDLASWGGRLEILPFRAGYATSELIRCIRNL